MLFPIREMCYTGNKEERVQQKMFFNLSKVSMISVLCAAITAPGFAASSVRSLGGAGTYVGTNSAVKTNATSTRTNTASAKTTAARSGALRVNPSSTRVTAGSASLRTPSTRSAATTQRLSLGKYLSGSSALSGGSSVKVDPEKSGLVSADEFDEVKVDVETLKEDLQELTGKEHITVYQDGNTVYIETEDGKPIEIPVIDETAAAEQLNTWLENNQIIKNLEQKILESGVSYEGSDDGFVSVTDNKISIAGAIASSLRNPTVTDSEKLVTVKQVTEYAIPKPDGCSGGTICVLSYNDDLDTLEWLELVDDTDVPVNPGATGGNTTVDTTMGDELSNDDNASVDSESDLTVSDEDIANGGI